MKPERKSLLNESRLGVILAVNIIVWANVFSDISTTTSQQNWTCTERKNETVNYRYACNLQGKDCRKAKILQQVCTREGLNCKTEYFYKCSQCPFGGQNKTVCDQYRSI